MTVSSARPAPPAPAAAVLSWDDYSRFLPFVRRTAMRLARRVGGIVSVADLEGTGFVGLVTALELRDPEATREAWDAYLAYRIRGAMLDYVASADDATHTAWAASRRLVRVIGRLEHALGRPPVEAEIAEEMGLTQEGYRRLLAMLAEAGVTRIESLDLDLIDDDAGDGAEPAVPLDVRLAAAVAALPRSLQMLLALRHQEGCTEAEIAAVLDEDEDRVVELYVETVHRLRASITRSIA